MPRTPQDLVAAGPWQSGSPTEEGKYLVYYQTTKTVDVDVFAYFPDTGWHLPTGEEAIICFAPIHLRQPDS